MFHHFFLFSTLVVFLISFPISELSQAFKDNLFSFSFCDLFAYPFTVWLKNNSSGFLLLLFLEFFAEVILSASKLFGAIFGGIFPGFFNGSLPFFASQRSISLEKNIENFQEFSGIFTWQFHLFQLSWKLGEYFFH